MKSLALKLKATKKTEKKLVQHLRKLNKPEEGIKLLRRALSCLPLIYSSIPQSPLILANNVPLDDFLAIREEFESVAKHLAYDSGTVLITELFRGAHECLVRVAAHMINDQCTITIGPRTLVEQGSYDIRYGNAIMQPDSSFRPRNVAGSPTLVIQILDSTHLATEIPKVRAILGANNVQGFLLVKLFRYRRAPAVAAAGGAVPRTVGDHTFSDPGFLGDRAVAAGEIPPVSEMALLYFRRGIAQPTIVRSGLGAPPAGFLYEPRDSIATLFPGVAVNGGTPGPFVVNTANYVITIPWTDIYSAPAGAALPAAVVAALAGAGAGLIFDPFTLWVDLEESMRFVANGI